MKNFLKRKCKSNKKEPKPGNGKISESLCRKLRESKVWSEIINQANLAVSCMKGLQTERAKTDEIIQKSFEIDLHESLSNLHMLCLSVQVFLKLDLVFWVEKESIRLLIESKIPQGAEKELFSVGGENAVININS